MNTLLSPEQLWNRYNDPEADLNVRVASRGENEDSVTGQVIIDGRIMDGATARISLRYTAAKDNRNLPAVIILGRPGKAVSEEERRFYATGGFFAVSVDYSACDPENPSVYPAGLGYCTFGNCGRYYDFVDASAADTVWFNWTYSVRRAIHYLLTEEKCPTVSVVSYGDASKIAAMILGVDERVSAGAIISGAIREKCEPEKLPGSEEQDAQSIAEFAGRGEEEALRRLTGIAPQTYLTMVKAPVLVMNETNSFTIDVAANEEAAGLVGELCSMVLVPRGIDAVDPKYSEYVRRWLLKPEKHIRIPVEAFLKDGELCVKADLVELSSVSEVRLFYRRGDKNPSAANWVEIADTVHLFDSCEGQCEVVDPDEPVLFFCNAVRMGKLLSSEVHRVVPSELGEVKSNEKSRILYKGKQGRGEFVSLDPTKPRDYAFYRDNPVCAATGPYEVAGVKGRYLSTFCLNDSKYVFDDGMTLNFDVYSKNESELSVYITSMWGTNEQCVYRNTQKLVGGDLWQKISLPVSELKLFSGKATDGGFRRMLLSFCCEDEIIVNNLLVI